jgi:CheY-like chemotaxis protein/anti-sigma regulatory factor (Ser/Thr protein kinase)
MSEVDFAEIVNDVCNAHAVAIERKNIHLIIDIKNSVPIVSDGNRLRQIVWNLISNSVRYTDSGSISVGCNLQEQTDGQTYLQFSVKDTGIGIPDEFISILFHRFTQIPNRRKGGSGLGLAITKGLVDLFGGKIDVSSQLDVGTKFIVNIPVDKVTNFKDRHHISKNKILLVEDDEAVSESFAYTLRTTGYEVTQVASVKDATKMLKEISYSVVVLDMQLEDGDGLDVVEIINSGPNSKTPVIAATANSHYLKDTRANRLAMKLIKPIQQTVLKDALASVLK